MTPDSSLPVWTIKPNWSEGIRETLSWATDVLASTYGPEQRRALRLSPRREFEMKFNPVDAVRSYFDLWLHRMGSFEFMAPLFHDGGRLASNIAIGATVIPFDTTYREFKAGDLAVLIGDDPFTFDKVTVVSITTTEIHVNAGEVTQAWPKGARIHPLRRARISQESQAAAITNRLGDATLQFQLNVASDLADEGSWSVTYGGYPVITTEPNRRENLDLTFSRNSLVLDNDQGLTWLADDAGRAFTLQVDNRLMRGRAEHWSFRQMLYRLRGQLGTVWLPTFNRDFQLSRQANVGDAFLNIQKIGYGYTGGKIDGRDHVFLPGGLCRAIIGTAGAPTLAEEHLTLFSNVGTVLPAGTFGSFMDTCRLASDSIEIQHHTDTDGTAECNLSFRAFRDPRTVPSIVSYPIPTAGMQPSMCGSAAPEEASCVDIPSGFWGEFIVQTNLGPNFPVMGPWSWSFSLSRGGVPLATIYNSDGAYSSYAGGTGFHADTGIWDYLTGWHSFFYTPDLVAPVESGWATDPFGGLDPDALHVNIQWPYNDYIFPGGSTFGDGQGTMSIKFQRLGGVLLDFGTIPIFGLWPASYDLVPL